MRSKRNIATQNTATQYNAVRLHQRHRIETLGLQPHPCPLTIAAPDLLSAIAIAVALPLSVLLIDNDS